jgi:integrase
MWRAVVGREGGRSYGPLRATPDEALRDRLRMQESDRRRPSQILTLEQALGGVYQATRLRGATARWVAARKSHGEFLLDLLGDPPMNKITKDQVLDLVLRARDEGRSPNTIRQKDLPLLAECFEVAGIDPAPIVEARQDLRRTLKYIPAERLVFDIGELGSLLERMRHGVWRRVALTCTACDKTWPEIVEDVPGLQQRSCPGCRRQVPVRGLRDGRVIEFESRETDADIVELLITTGVRSGELSRVRVSDVDLRTRRIRVREPKDRGNPRYLQIPEGFAPAVRRLLAAAPVGRPDAALIPDAMNRICGLCRRWKPRLQEPRLSGRNFRRSFITALVSSGVVAGDVKSLAGHRLLSTTDRYVQDVTGRHADHVDQLSRQFHGGRAATSDEAPPPAAEQPDEDPPADR